MNLPEILIIDDDLEFASDLMAVLTPGFVCRAVASGEEGLGAIAWAVPDAVVLDLVLGGGRSGLDVLDEIHRIDPHLPVVMATDHPSPETEAEALRRGALYYLRKAAGRAEIVSKLEKCAEVGRIGRERDELRSEAGRSRPILLARSVPMRMLESTIDRIAAASNTTVLLTGECGTGKSLIAREIHRRSPRNVAPFLQVNVASIREELADSELFGHVRGSFTGAVADHKGYFETVRGGTLFFDEVGDLPLKVQGRLLTALEEREILPVGSATPRSVHVRIIAATNRDLAAACRDGNFREDLLSRLQVVTLAIPPLREHAEDIPDLARYYLGRFAAEMRLSRVTITDAGMERLQKHSWRSYNVRELKNTLERALVFHGHQGVLGPECFDLSSVSSADDHGPGGFDYSREKERAIESFQREFFVRAFRAVGGCFEYPTPEAVVRVAELTGIPRQTVSRILRELTAPCPVAERP